MAHSFKRRKKSNHCYNKNGSQEGSLTTGFNSNLSPYYCYWTEMQAAKNEGEYFYLRQRTSLFAGGLLSSSQLPSRIGLTPSVYRGHQWRSQRLPKSQARAEGAALLDPSSQHSAKLVAGAGQWPGLQRGSGSGART